MPLNDQIDLGLKREAFVNGTGIHTTVGIGSVPTVAASYVTAAEYGSGGAHRTVLTVTLLPIVTADFTTDGAGGSLQIYDFPKGYILIQSGSQAWDLITTTGVGIEDDTVCDIGVGSTAYADDTATLSGTAEDIINKDDLTFSAVTITDEQILELTGGAIDGTSTAVNAFLNLAAEAASAEPGVGGVTFTGTIIIDWVNYGFFA